MKPDLIAEQQPKVVLQQLGLSVGDVKFIIITHFHADHISGLKQFPNARFITDDGAFNHVQKASTLANSKHGIFAELFPNDFADRMISISTLNRSELGHHKLEGADLLGDGSMVSVELPGHSTGHFGVLINSGGKSLFYAVDTQWHLQAVTENRIPGLPTNLIAEDHDAWVRSTQWVGEILKDGYEVVLCHHPEDGPFDFNIETGTT